MFRPLTQENKPTQESVSIDTINSYEALLRQARTLADDGKYKESNETLAQIPVTDLGKKGMESLKVSVNALMDSNTKALEEAQNQPVKNKSSTSTIQTDETPPAKQDFGQFATVYYFYYQAQGNHQYRLTISPNGDVLQEGVTQNQATASGSAMISSYRADVLSYVINERVPSSKPATKTITSDVQIIVTWENGEQQTFYGYTTNIGQIALTDGISNNGSVNEVWMTNR
ncbi:MAG: hypothetical protein LBV67_08480 [Streptococcaceae bacterium]|nr:hypothetical protein [Streptococcaceae bacterium]